MSGQRKETLMATDEREWTLAGSMDSKGSMLCILYGVRRGEVVVPKTRAEAAEQRVLDLGNELLAARGSTQALGAEMAERQQRVRELEKQIADVQSFWDSAAGEAAKGLEAKLATAVEALKTARRRIRQLHEAGFDSTRRQIALDAICEIDDSLSEIEQGDTQ